VEGGDAKVKGLTWGRRRGKSKRFNLQGRRRGKSKRFNLGKAER